MAASSGRNTAQAWAVFSKQPLCHSVLVPPCKPETEHITAPAGCRQQGARLTHPDDTLTVSSAGEIISCGALLERQATWLKAR